MKTPTTQTTQTDALYAAHVAARTTLWNIHDQLFPDLHKVGLETNPEYQAASAAMHDTWVAFLKSRDAAKS
jgi:hypothetical protein